MNGISEGGVCIEFNDRKQGLSSFATCLTDREWSNTQNVHFIVIQVLNVVNICYYVIILIFYYQDSFQRQSIAPFYNSGMGI